MAEDKRPRWWTPAWATRHDDLLDNLLYGCRQWSYAEDYWFDAWPIGHLNLTQPPEDQKHAHVALSALNMEARGFKKLRGLLTLEKIEGRNATIQKGWKHPQRELTLDERILGPPGLEMNFRPQDLCFTPIIDQNMGGEEPLLLFNQKMRQIAPGCDWTQIEPEGVRDMENILPMSLAGDRMTTSLDAGPMPTDNTLVACICALENALAQQVVVESQEQIGRWEAKTQDWEFDPGAVLAWASGMPVQYEVPEEDKPRTAKAYEYDFWYFPANDETWVELQGHFFPDTDKDLSFFHVGAPEGSWRNAMPVAFPRQPPSFRAYLHPIRAISRFAWAKAMRAAQGDPLSLTDEAVATCELLGYLLTLLCVENLPTLSEALRNRPSSLPVWHRYACARLQFIKNNRFLASGRRIFPVGVALSSDEAVPRSEQRRKRVAAENAEVMPRKDTRPRWVTPQGTPVRNGFFSRRLSARLEEFWRTHERMLLFLEDRLADKSLDLKDLLGGWPRIEELLKGGPYECEAEMLVRAKLRLAEEATRQAEDDDADAIDEQNRIAREERLRREAERKAQAQAKKEAEDKQEGRGEQQEQKSKPQQGSAPGDGCGETDPQAGDRRKGDEVEDEDSNRSSKRLCR